MKKILIPTDFSQNAKNATDYALSLFNEKNTEITLLNVFYIPYAPIDVAHSYNDVTSENAEQLFQQELKRIAKKNPHLKASISTLFEVGDVVNVVRSLEREFNYELIVMGTKGASGLAEVFVGSRTSAMIKSVKTPVLVIPEAAKFKPIKRILFTADEEFIDQKLNVEILKEIAQTNHSKIEALYISESSENEELIKKFIDHKINLNFKDIPHQLNSKNGIIVENEIQKYTENNSIDLIAMVTTNGNLFHNLFHTSVTKQVAMHTKMPLLVMHSN